MSTERTSSLAKDKYRREIEEILENTDLPEEPGPRKDGERTSAQTRLRLARPKRLRIPRPVASSLIITPGRLFLAGLAVLLLGMIIRPAYYPLLVIALALFGSGSYMKFKRMERERARRHWRGDVIDLPNSWTARFRRWFRNK